jgi:DNA-binding SARP family transcriptional activator
MSDRLELRILGPLELLRGGVPASVGGVKPRQLLATLALHHGRTVSVDRLIDVLWSQDPPRSAVANVHTYVSSLRAQLGEDRLRRQPPGYRLQLDPAELDVARFDEWTRAADPSGLDAALALWRGNPVEDLPPAPLWMPELERLAERWRTLRHVRARLRIESGDPLGALADLQALVAEDPLREEAWLLLVTALEATGRRAEALATYANARRVLVAELGIEPSAPLRQLHHNLLLEDHNLPLEDHNLLLEEENDLLRQEHNAPALAGTARLDGDAAAILRGLALLDLGPVPGWVAAALLGRAGDRAQQVLHRLVGSRLVRRAGVDEIGQRRFALPIVVGLLAPDLPGDQDEELLGRVLGGYLALAEQAARALPAQIFGPGLRVAPRWAVPDAAELTKDPAGWFTAEREALLGAVELAARTDRSALAWEFAHALVPWCDLGGHSAEWEQAHRSALAACRRTRDLLGEAVSLRGLGQLHLYRDHYGAAAEAFGRSRLVYARLGNLCGEAGALAGLGAVHRIRGELDAAYECYRQALTAYVTIGDRHGQAYAHGALGMVWLARAELAEALRCLREGLAIAGEVHDRHRIAHLTHQLGVVRLRLGEPAEARGCLAAALEHFADLGDAHGEAYCLSDLAGLERGEAATEGLTRALEIFERIGDRRAQGETARRLGELHRDAGRDRLGAAYLAEASRLQATVELELRRAELSRD